MSEFKANVVDDCGSIEFEFKMEVFSKSGNTVLWSATLSGSREINEAKTWNDFVDGKRNSIVFESSNGDISIEKRNGNVDFGISRYGDADGSGEMVMKIPIRECLRAFQGVARQLESIQTTPEEKHIQLCATR